MPPPFLTPPPHQQTQYQEAADAARGKGRFSFLGAYALYRLEKLDEALAALGGPSSSSPEGEDDPVSPSAHLRAQILYRQGEYASCAGHYAALAEVLQGDAEADPQDTWDAQLNLLACLVSSGQGPSALAHPALADVLAAVAEGNVLRDDLPYELVYNVACVLLDDGRPGAAARALEQALAVGARFLSQDGGAAPAAVLHELAQVRAQAALLLQGAHYDDAAEAVYAQIAGSGKGKHHGSGADAATLAAVANNRAVALAATVLEGGGPAPSSSPSSAAAATSSSSSSSSSSNRWAVDALKRIGHALAAVQAAKLTRRQVLTLQANRALLLLHLRRLDDCASALAEARSAVVDAPAAPYVTAVAQHLDTIDASLRHQRALVAAGPAAGAGVLAEALKALAGASPSASTAALPSGVAAFAQALMAEGKFADAADALLRAAPPTCTAVAAAVAELRLAAGQSVEEASKPLDGLVSARKAQAAGAAASTASFAARDSVASAVQALATRAGLLATAGRFDGAAADISSILDFKAALTAEQRASALACLATLRMQQAAAAKHSEVALRERLVREADTFLKEAASAAGPQAAASRGRRGSRAGVVADLDAAALDALEWTAPDQRKAAAAAAVGASSSSSSSPAAAAPATSPRVGPLASPASAGAAAATTTAGSGPSAADEAAIIAARAAAKKAKEKKRRAKRRIQYLARLKASGKYDLVGLPEPQADRWIPRRDRFRKVRKGAKGYATGTGHQGGVDARMEKQLDAKARADAGGASSSSQAASAPTSAAAKKAQAEKASQAQAAAAAAAVAAAGGGAKKKGKGKK